MISTQKEDTTIDIIDPGRRLFKQKIDPSTTILELKQSVRKRVDDSDLSRFSIHLGELKIEDGNTIGYYEQVRKDYDFQMYNYRIEMIDGNIDVNSTYKFKFSDFDYRDFNIPSNHKISTIKRFLVDNKMPYCEDYNSIALCYKTNDELDDQITLRCIGIAKNEPIVVKAISYQYRVIHPDGTPLVYTMKKRDKVLDLKNKILQTYHHQTLKISDFSLQISGEPFFLQDNSDLYYERITKDKTIYAIILGQSSHSRCRLPRPNTYFDSPLRMSLPNHQIQRTSIPVKHSHKSSSHSKGVKSISYKDLEGFVETRSRLSTIYLFQYQKTNIKTDLIEVELPYPCTFAVAKTLLVQRYLSLMIFNITNDIVKIKANTPEKEEEKDEDEMPIQKLMAEPSYIVEIDFIIKYQIKNRKIQKVFTHCPTFSEAQEAIKEDLLKMNPQYTTFTLEYQDQKLTHIHLEHNSTVTVKIEGPTENLDSLVLCFKYSNKPDWETPVELTNSLAEIYEMVKTQLNTSNSLSLLFQGSVLESRSDIFVSDLKTSAILAKKPIYVYEKLSVKDMVHKTASVSKDSK